MTISRLGAVAVLLGLLPAACASYETTQATAPTVTFDYSAVEDAEEVAERADDYCEDRYDSDAFLIDTEQTAGGYQATFSCR